MYIQSIFKNLMRNRKGGPILEEILLIGIAVIIFVVIMGLLAGLIDWTTFSIRDFFS